MLFSAIFNFCWILKQKSICKVIWGQYYQELLRSSGLHCPKPQWSSSLVKCARWPRNGTASSLCTFLKMCLDMKRKHSNFPIPSLHFVCNNIIEDLLQSHKLYWYLYTERTAELIWIYIWFVFLSCLKRKKKIKQLLIISLIV